MVELPDDELFERHAELCKVLCNAKRLKLLHVLRAGEYSVNELAEETSIPQPTVSQHLRKMRDKGVVAKRTEGTHCYYRIRDPRLMEATMQLREILLDILEEDAFTSADL